VIYEKNLRQKSRVRLPLTVPFALQGRNFGYLATLNEGDSRFGALRDCAQEKHGARYFIVKHVFKK
jgi:hypothetical protein